MSSVRSNTSSKQMKGKCARKSTSAKPPRKTPTPESDLDYGNEKHPDVVAAIRAQKALEALQFSNPGRLNSDVPSSSKRSRRTAFKKAKELTASHKENDSTSKSATETPQLCDCIRPDCKGCFPKCKKCGSRKCGRYCQVNRTWTVVERVIPGCNAKPLKNETNMVYAETEESDAESSTCSEDE